MLVVRTDMIHVDRKWEAGKSRANRDTLVTLARFCPTSRRLGFW